MGKVFTAQHSSNLVACRLAVLLQEVNFQSQKSIVHRSRLRLCCYVHIL